MVEHKHHYEVYGFESRQAYEGSTHNSQQW